MPALLILSVRGTGYTLLRTSPYSSMHQVNDGSIFGELQPAKNNRVVHRLARGVTTEPTGTLTTAVVVLRLSTGTSSSI